MKPTIVALVFAACLILATTECLAKLVINEIYPAPPSGEEEWVEVYNDSETVADLTVYSLTDREGKAIKWTETFIPAFGFVAATSTNVLNNSGDTVRLTNGGELVDSFEYPSTTSLESWQRCPDGTANWLKSDQTSRQTSNRLACPQPSPTQEPPPASQTPTAPARAETGRIFLSEVMPYPESGNEWVELYNDNDFAVSLLNWFIDDILDKGSSPKLFSLNLEAKGYGTVELTSSVFNNDGDTVRLINDQETEVDSFDYSQTLKGQSFSKKGAEWCSTAPSKNSQNSDCSQSITTPVITLEAGVSPTSQPLPGRTEIRRVEPVVTLGNVFYPLNRQKVLGAATKSPRVSDKYPEVLGSLERGALVMGINFGLNLSCLAYILGYYYVQKNSQKPLFPA